jgi:uncharacterized protein
VRPLFVLLAALLATPLAALEVPPSPSQWITDAAGLLDAAQEDALNRKLADFEQQSGAQFIIYIFPSLEGESVEDFTIRAVERWKVGQKKYDNGLVLFVFVKERTVRIETGYGLEGTITDAFASRVIRQFIAPHFQRQDWAGGLNAAADAIIAKIRTGEEPVAPARRRGAQTEEAPTIPGIVFFIVIFVLIFFVLPALARRRGGCGGCIWPLMFFPGGGSGVTFGGHRGGWGGGGGGFGGFSGGGGSFGGGGATGGW